MRSRITSACLVFVALLAQPSFAENHPNVIVIHADDLGWSDTALNGITDFYKTPNIERLAKRGMTFTER